MIKLKIKEVFPDRHQRLDNILCNLILLLSIIRLILKLPRWAIGFPK